MFTIVQTVLEGYGMSEKVKRKKRKRRKATWEESVLYELELDLYLACIELDKKRRQDYIV